MNIFLNTNIDMNTEYAIDSIICEDVLSTLEQHGEDLIGYTILDYEESPVFSNVSKTKLYIRNTDIINKVGYGIIVKLYIAPESTTYLEENVVQRGQITYAEEYLYYDTHKHVWKK